MHTLLRTALVLTLALLVAACGGDSGDGDGGGASKAKKDPREGYFDDEQSDALNPRLADYDAASDKYYNEAKACEREADRLFAAGKGERVAVKCHFDLVDGYRDAAAALREELEGIEGDYREPCMEQRDAFVTHLETFEDALGTVRADWDTYAAGKGVPPKLQAHSNVVDELAKEFVVDRVPSMAQACYTADDRAAAAKQATSEEPAAGDDKG